MARHKRKSSLHHNSGNLKKSRRSGPQQQIKIKDVILDQEYSLPFLIDAPFPESVLDQALSVQEGKFANLRGLVRSMYGRLPRASDNLPIPSQHAPPRRISTDTAIYKAMTLRASALMSGKLPPDGTEPCLWNNTIGPRIANVLLRVAKRSRPSALEISAYLHMVLVDFFIGGHRSPKVTIEKSFGDFLMEGTPQDTEWDNSVIKGKPQFLILRRGEELVGSHWYVIIVDINAKKAYCLDSKVDQHTKTSHIEAFSCLQKAWAVRLPQIPVPDRMIELHSFTQSDYHGSGFLCLYHIMLLFRRPHGLTKLKHGNITMPQEYLDDITQPAEKYIGIKVTDCYGTSNSCRHVKRPT
ncbi:hypothetical protein F4824DRAFT_511911 [Ustulina deusta]|nr:hypothetical protein F4824DRAFT_511911 [Ustulina deusta]